MRFKDDIIRKICDSAQLACLLEISSLKPGNVNRLSDYEDIRYEHFLASAVAIRNSLENLLKDFIYKNKITLGKHIYYAIKDTQKMQSGGNTNLGIVLLIYPISVALAECLLYNESISKSFEKVPRILSKTTYLDTVYLYKAIRTAKPRIKENVEELDVFSDESFREIRKKKINLYNIFKISKNDLIAEELVNGLKRVKKGYIEIKRMYKVFNDISLAVSYSYIKILSMNIDTLVVNKFDRKTALMVSELCREVVNSSEDVIRVCEIYYKIAELDKFFKSRKINPGTTADIITASLMIALLDGLRV